MILEFGATALGCLIAGLGGGYWIGKKKTELEAFHIANMEIARDREYYSTYYRTKYEEKLLALTAENLQTLDEAVEEPMVGAYSEADIKATEKTLNQMPAERIRSQYETATTELPVQQEVVRPKPPVSIGVERATQVAEPRKRPIVQYAGMFKAEQAPQPEVEEKATDDPVDKMAPHDISEDEYFDSDALTQQRQLTWYAPDEVLADMADNPVEEPRAVVGDCLDLFSDMDPEDNVIYVRNPRIQTVFEITRSHESFAESVQGLMR